MNGKRRDSGTLTFLIMALLAFVMFLIVVLFFKRGEEEDYEYLLDRRDRLQDELFKLNSMKLEGKISEKEYEEISRRYIREIRRIEEKLEKMEKRRRKSKTTF